MKELNGATYALPNPHRSDERDRLDLQHQSWLLSFDGDLKAPSLPPDFEPKSVLDVACGPGVWASAYALEHPDCKVVAFDINPPTIEDGPANLSIIHKSVDLGDENQWPKGQLFDYIHLRMLMLAVRDWPDTLRICWNHLNPGGWIEMDDSRVPWFAENPSATVENSQFIQMGYLIADIQNQRGYDLSASSQHVERLGQQGFIQTDQSMVKWPMNGVWPSDGKMKRLGALTLKNFRTFASHVPALLGNTASMSVTEAEEFCKVVLNEVANDRDMHYYLHQDITIAQKPLTS